MKPINILITAVGGDIGGNIINILSTQNLIKFNIFATDINKEVFQYNKLYKFFKIPKTTHKKYAEQIIKIVKDENIDLIIPVSENEIIWFNKNIKLFDKLDVKILINNPHITDTFLNKLETSKVLERISIDTPKTFLLSKYKNQLNFPLVIKAISSTISKEIYIIKNQLQLKCLLQTIENKDSYITQEYVGSIDDEYTTTVYKHKNDIKVITFKRKLTGGMTSHATIKDEKVLKKYAKKIATEFQLQGSINIQSRKVDNKFYIFEINPRFSSTILIRNHFNFSDLLWWIDDTMKLHTIDKNKKIVNKGVALLGYTYNFFNDKGSNA